MIEVWWWSVFFLWCIPCSDTCCCWNKGAWTMKVLCMVEDTVETNRHGWTRELTPMFGENLGGQTPLMGVITSTHVRVPPGWHHHRVLVLGESCEVTPDKGIKFGPVSKRIQTPRRGVNNFFSVQPCSLHSSNVPSRSANGRQFYSELQRNLSRLLGARV